MTVNAYSIYDKAAGTFATPFFAVNDQVAKRNFRFSLNKLSDLFIADLELHLVGAFDVEDGSFDNDFGYTVDTGENVLSEREIEKKNSEVKQ
ncbi:nonstructural protein [Chicken microvirus mg6_218]|nr:nonstructural protein [Chicken microvirus mg6_218]